MSIRIVLVDPHTIVRHCLDTVIRQEEDMEVVGQAGDGLAAVAAARELLPDLVVMEIGLPELNGIEATRQIQKEAPGVRVLALSTCSARRHVIEMFRAGASGYLLKSCDCDELTRAIREVGKGRTYMSPAISGIMMEDLEHRKAATKPSAFSTLTQREREILQLLADGKDTRQTALRLHLSPKTVEAHRLRMMHKLQFDSSAQLVKYALQEGLTSPEP